MSPLPHTILATVSLLSPSIPTMLSIFPIEELIHNGRRFIPISTTPPAQAVAPPPAIGMLSPLTQHLIAKLTLRSPSIPTMPFTFHTAITTSMAASGMLPVQPVAQAEVIGTKLALMQQQTIWDTTTQSPLMPTMLSTLPIVITPMVISSTSLSILLRICMATQSAQTYLQD